MFAVIIALTMPGLLSFVWVKPPLYKLPEGASVQPTFYPSQYVALRASIEQNRLIVTGRGPKWPTTCASLPVVSGPGQSGPIPKTG